VLVWTITSIFTAFSAGTLALAGRAFGAGDRTLAADVVGASLALALGVGALVAVSTLVATRLTLPWLFPHAGDAVLVDVARYLELVLPVLPLAFVEAIAASALHAAGDTRTPLVAAAASNAINLLLSCVLVFGLLGAPALGVRGAAIGAAAAMTVQAIALVRALLSPSSAIPLGPWLRRARVDRDVLGRLVRVSLPAFGDKLVYAGGYLAFIMLVATLGPVAMAANQAVVSVEAICFLSAEGFGVAAGALAAQRLGAGQPSAAEQTTRVAITMAVCALTAFGLLFAAAPRALLSPFTSDQAVLGAATASLVMAALAQPFMAYATVTRMALRGAGATSSVLWVTVAGHGANSRRKARFEGARAARGHPPLHALRRAHPGHLRRLPRRRHPRRRRPPRADRGPRRRRLRPRDRQARRVRRHRRPRRHRRRHRRRQRAARRHPHDRHRRRRPALSDGHGLAPGHEPRRAHAPHHQVERRRCPPPGGSRSTSTPPSASPRPASPARSSSRCPSTSS
jgi:putative MATE family efflux protein